MAGLGHGFRVVVISPDSPVPEESRRWQDLIAAGCSGLHLRRPAWNLDRMCRYLEALPAVLLSSLVVHVRQPAEADSLWQRFPLAGVHLADGLATPTRVPEERLSQSCHRLDDLPRLEQRAYGFLSPIFDAHSKPGYRAAFPADGLAAALLVHRRRRPAGRGLVLALGGLTPERLPLCQAWGFDGVAVLGAIWLTGDPVISLGRFLAAANLPTAAGAAWPPPGPPAADQRHSHG